MNSDFKWSNRNKVENRWRTSFYAPGMGFETGNKVYVGRNDWNTEASAIEAQERHESAQHAIDWETIIAEMKLI